MLSPTMIRLTVCLLAICPWSVRAAETGRSSADNIQRADMQVRLMSEQKHRQLLRSLPKVTDPWMQQVLNSDRLVLYTDQEMPPAYQDWDGSLQGVHWTMYNISADASEPYGNANREFPWGSPAGTHRTKNVTSFRFFYLPSDENGKLLPIVWYRKRYRGDSTRGYAWTFPVGTVFGEVLRLKSPTGRHYTFELRVRIRENGNWSVDVFRPFPTAQDLLERVVQLRPAWQKDPLLARFVRHLKSPIEMPRMRLRNEHPTQLFNQSMGVDRLPEVGDDALVETLLTTSPFQSAAGTVWRISQNDLWTCAPTTEAEFHIVPARYDAGFIAVDRISCARCHQSVGQHARQFEFPRDWYGRVRGSDGIFSFHPFEPSSISRNGMGNPVQMRSELVQPGWLEQYDPRIHLPQRYDKVPYLEN